MKEVKIQIPDNCELIKDGDTYIVREKKQGPPRSWNEFCVKYPVRKGEASINTDGYIYSATEDCDGREYINWCVSKEEAEAFLALMQLRQLRKAWIRDWEDINKIAYSIYIEKGTLEVSIFSINRVLYFPTKEMARDFLNCFKELCETAKILL